MEQLFIVNTLSSEMVYTEKVSLFPNAASFPVIYSVYLRLKFDYAAEPGVVGDRILVGFMSLHKKAIHSMSVIRIK